jgi:hypothetical protein
MLHDLECPDIKVLSPTSLTICGGLYVGGEPPTPKDGAENSGHTDASLKAAAT